MAIRQPQLDRRPGLSGGRDVWDDGLVGALLSADYFAAASGGGGGYTLTALGGTYTVTGGSVVIERDRRLIAQGGSYTTTGSSAQVNRNRRLISNGGAYTLTGSQADLSYSAGAVSYTLTCIGGAYVASGAAAVLRRNRRLTASGGTYTIAGGTVVLMGGTPLDATGGLFWPIVRRRRR